MCVCLVDVVSLSSPGVAKCREPGPSAGSREGAVDGASSPHHPAQRGFGQRLPGQADRHRS